MNSQQIQKKLQQISQQRFHYDTYFLQLQSFINNKCQSNRSSIHQIRIQFSTKVSKLKSIVRDNKEVLQKLAYRCQKSNGTKQNEKSLLLQRIANLGEYFEEYKKKIQNQAKRAEEIISSRQRWQIIGNGNKPGSIYQFDEEEQSLIRSRTQLQDAKAKATLALTGLRQQQTLLTQGKNKMSQVLMSINFAGNVLQMIRSRSRQDNKLILILSIGLVFELIFCLFFVKPWFRGE